ncbi:T6SS phospholipase effector Tle1-like catalytic domain-containing protein [Proteus vulgaris]|uniref:DUF2235 domain-containing protein n=1 Tax=Proteus vulgaris TaxID=585 RepID=A0A6G6SKG7_PROVU|nr:DUF2235 domain-containing protein [Proteus vulgaris]QIF95025.1 DUF2235 domain-containing protein [Proteus vulgaris]WIF71307.1 DUF2235 domain-containing protein [Proteus vulgaris]
MSIKILTDKQLHFALIHAIKANLNDQHATKGDPCWAPPNFPEQGRLTLNSQQVRENIKKIELEENKHKHYATEKGTTQCCKSLHVSFFFDGTNNNNKNDTDDAKPPHPTNVAKLYHACAPNDYQAKQKGFYAYYMPGVGTPFPEIKTYEYYSSGLTYATGGQARISWALIQIYNTLFHAVTGHELTLAKMRILLLKMSNSNSHNPANILLEQFRAIRNKIIKKKPKLVALKLYIYGFSRGAAEARTFVYWLDKFLIYLYTQAPPLRPLMFPKGTIYGIPVSVEFLGIFDTVPAVGLANVMPMFTGHNGWANGTQQLPKSDLIKNCYHFVAAHEQRQSFAVDSIRTPEGNYPSNTIEVIYPGMHSDIGGGYPSGDQGKARAGHKELISQIALHDMYATAIDAGAPLALSEEFFSLLPKEKQEKYIFRLMKQSSLKEFEISKSLIDKYNIWREQTLPEITIKKEDNNIKSYIPNRFITADIESVIECQLILITAWRIGRYASSKDSEMNLTKQDFFKNAPQHADIKAQPYEPEFSKQASSALAKEYSDIESKSTKIRKNREKEQSKQTDVDNWQPSPENIGPPLFDATNARGQFWEASLEFKADYNDLPRPSPLIQFTLRTEKACQGIDYYHSIDNPYYKPDTTCDSLPENTLPIGVVGQSLFLQNLDGTIEEYVHVITYQDEHYEYLSLIEKSKYIYSILKPVLIKNNRDSYLGEIIDLLDNHIHDSRAWFMHSESGLREPFGGYFLSRMIYFGDKWSKSMRILSADEFTYRDKNNKKYIKLDYLPTYGLSLINKKIESRIKDDKSIQTNQVTKIINKLNEIKKDKNTQKISNSLNRYINN